MNKLDIQRLIESKCPGFFKPFPRFITSLAVKILEKVLHLEEMNQFLAAHRDKKGLALIDEFFEQLDFSFLVSCRDRQKIPSEGRLICVANHPLGALDALAILRALSDIRTDVRVIANDVLRHLEGLENLFLPYDISAPRFQRSNINAVARALQREQVVLTFPAAEVARLGIAGIKESSWQKGAVYFANKYHTPILPIYVHAKNSLLFYVLSFFSKKLSMFLLPGEMFKKRSRSISLKIGDPIPAKVFSSGYIEPQAATRLLRRHLFLIGRNKKGVFKTEKSVIHPVDRKHLKSELRQARFLGSTIDGKKILLVDHDSALHAMREIARLREITFRRVGEGTGKKMDTDLYDRHYKHIVLWDEEDLEIVGSYRLGIGEEILGSHGLKGFYTATLFGYSKTFESLLPQAIELGRSFVQQKYWNSRALDYLWRGIGAFVAGHPQVRYLFGGVSISNSYPGEAKDLIVYFYRKWFGDELLLAAAKHRYTMTPKREAEVRAILGSNDYDGDFKKLKDTLKQYGYAVPVLYKQYSDLCEPGGAKFLDFGVDKDFENCVDGLILVDLERMTEAKKQRYIYKQANGFTSHLWGDLIKGERHAQSLAG